MSSAVFSEYWINKLRTFNSVYKQTNDFYKAKDALGGMRMLDLDTVATAILSDDELDEGTKEIAAEFRKLFIEYFVQ